MGFDSSLPSSSAPSALLRVPWGRVPCLSQGLHNQWLNLPGDRLLAHPPSWLLKCNVRYDSVSSFIQETLGGPGRVWMTNACGGGPAQSVWLWRFGGPGFRERGGHPVVCTVQTGPAATPGSDEVKPQVIGLNSCIDFLMLRNTGQKWEFGGSCENRTSRH